MRTLGIVEDEILVENSLHLVDGLEPGAPSLDAKMFVEERAVKPPLYSGMMAPGAEGRDNHRNGYSKKSVLTGTAKMTVSAPRDRPPQVWPWN